MPLSEVEVLLSGSVRYHEQDRSIKLWNPRKGIPIKTYTGKASILCRFVDRLTCSIDLPTRHISRQYCKMLQGMAMMYEMSQYQQTTASESCAPSLG